MQKKNYEKVYVPESFLSFEGFDQTLHRHVTKDRIAYFVSVVACRATWQRKEPDAFVNVCTTALKEAIKRVKPVVDFVLDSGYVVSDNQYIPGEKCRGYRINPLFESRVLNFRVKDKRIMRCIRSKKKRQRMERSGDFQS